MKKKTKQYVYTSKKDTEDLTKEAEAAEKKRDLSEKRATGLPLSLKDPSFWKDDV